MGDQSTVPVVEKKKGDGFLQDGDGNFSSMRLFSLIALVNAAGLTWFGLGTGKAVIPWLVAAFVPKAIQSFAERPLPAVEAKK
jgi:hypothetical protein